MAAKKRVDSKGRVLKSGEQQRTQDGRYLYRYSDNLGKRKTIYALSLSELREKEIQVQRDLQDGIDHAGGEMTLNALFALYMRTKTNLRQSSRAQYISSWNNKVKNSQLGEMKIKDIKSAHIASLYSDFSKRGFCESTIREVHKLINACLEMAAESDMIRKNPAKSCAKYISGDKHERTALTREEESELLTFIRNDDVYSMYYPLVSFMLNTGLRASELCGLTWDNVDMKANTIHVEKQLTYHNYDGHCKYYISDLKTKSAKRTVPLTKEARAALLNQRQNDLALGKQKKEVAGLNDYVFTNLNGMPWTGTAINSMLVRVIDKHNQNKNLTPLRQVSSHILRHSFASRACESGMDAKTLQIVLGHNDIATTMNIYVQQDAGEIQRKFHEVEQDMMVI